MQQGSAYFIEEVSTVEETHTLSVLVDNEPGVPGSRDRPLFRTWI